MSSFAADSMTDREWQLHAALSALLAEINTRCIKSDSAVRLVAIDEELILTAEAALGESDEH